MGWGEGTKTCMYFYQRLIHDFRLQARIIYYTQTLIGPRSGTEVCAVYNVPFVEGTSFPPVLSIAARIARASALNADSALRGDELQREVST